MTGEVTDYPKLSSATWRAAATAAEYALPLLLIKGLYQHAVMLRQRLGAFKRLADG